MQKRSKLIRNFILKIFFVTCLSLFNSTGFSKWNYEIDLTDLSNPSITNLNTQRSFALSKGVNTFDSNQIGEFAKVVKHLNLDHKGNVTIAGTGTLIEGLNVTVNSNNNVTLDGLNIACLNAVIKAKLTTQGITQIRKTDTFHVDEFYLVQGKTSLSDGQYFVDGWVYIDPKAIFHSKNGSDLVFGELKNMGKILAGVLNVNLQANTHLGLIIGTVVKMQLGDQVDFDDLLVYAVLVFDYHFKNGAIFTPPPSKTKVWGAPQENATRKKKVYKIILSLKGGGTRGVGSLEILKEIKDGLIKQGLQINSCRDIFDFFTGVSTGSIIAASIGVGRSVEELLEFYKEKCPKIFHTSWWREFKNMGGLTGSTYDINTLLEVLKEEIGDLNLEDVFKEEEDKYILIPAFDLISKETIFFSNYGPYAKTKATSAVAGSCAAPTYFKPLHTQIHQNTQTIDVELVDGGCTNNNPASFGLSEARGCFPSTEEEDVHYIVVSIGTGYSAKSYEVSDGGLANWGSEQLISVLTDAPASGARAQVNREAQQPHSKVFVYDIDFKLPKIPKNIPLDTTDEKILELLIKAAQQECTRHVIDQFCKDIKGIQEGIHPEHSYVGPKEVSLETLMELTNIQKIPVEKPAEKSTENLLGDSWIFVKKDDENTGSTG